MKARRKKPPLGPLLVLVVTVGLCGAAVAGLVYVGGVVAWICLGSVGFVVVAFLCLIALALFNYNTMAGVLAQGQRPLHLLFRGQREQAEQDFQIALKRAKGFPADDCRRGLLMCKLGRYLEQIGKGAAAAELFIEGLGILEVQRKVEPMVYLIGLNDYAVFLIHTWDFEKGQALLETAFDWTAIARKDHRDKPIKLHDRLPEMEFVLRLNLATLFLAISALPEARRYLQEAEQLVESLRKRDRSDSEDTLLSLNALWHLKSGLIDEAQSLCERVQNRSGFIYPQVRAKIHLARKQFREAAELLGRLLVGALEIAKNRPQLLEPMLDYAESLFGKGDHEGAFVAVRSARTLVSSDRIPQHLAWRSTLETWLQRARELGRSDAIVSLEAALQMIPPTSNQGITILEKFRISPPAE